MPVEITLPLTKLEQAVADARANEKIMAARVEDAKLVLKTAKAAWEESVGALMLAVDEMIQDKRQPSRRRGCSDTPPAAQPVPEPPTPPAPAGDPIPSPTFTEVEILVPAPSVHPGAWSGKMLPAPDPEPDTGPKWRALPVTELEAPQEVFNAFDAFGVTTLGDLADALKSGATFNLKLTDVIELQEAIEDVSQDDPEPIKFDREVAITVKEQEEEESAAEPDLFSEPDPEPAKPPAKKARSGGRKKKTAEPAAKPVAMEPGSDFDGL